MPSDETTGQWETWFEEWAQGWASKQLRQLWKPEYNNNSADFWLLFRPQPPERARKRFLAPTPADLRWLANALTDPRRRWFVARLVCGHRENALIPDPLFEPLMEAAINSRAGSANKMFVEPCATTFGKQRVREYLTAVLVSTNDAGRIVGALDASYWVGGSPNVKEYKTRLLEMFVDESDPYIFGRIYNLTSEMWEQPDTYPTSYRPLLARARQKAKDLFDNTK